MNMKDKNVYRLAGIAGALAMIMIFSTPAMAQQYGDNQPKGYYRQQNQSGYGQQQDYGDNQQRNYYQPYRQNPSDDQREYNRSGEGAERFQQWQQRYGDGQYAQLDQWPYGDQQRSERREDLLRYGTNQRQLQADRSRFRQQQKQQRVYRLDPQAMIRVGYDLNNDGILDTFEYLSYYDVQKARENTRNRQQGAYGGEYRGQSSPQRDQFASRANEQPMDSIQGQIKELKTINLSEMDEPDVLARIAVRNGRTAKVDLGPEKKISALDLQQGDPIRVTGREGTINDKSVLMAYWVEHNNQRVSINRPQDKNIQRYSARILKTKSTKIGDRGNDLMARVRLDNGRTTIVNLGPEKGLKENLNLRNGQDIEMLARPAYIDGKKALVAEMIHADGRTVDIDWQGKASIEEAASGQTG